MPAITFGGLASGLPPNIVDQLVEVERAPIRKLEVHKEKVNAQLKLVNELETKIQDVGKNLTELIGTKGFNDLRLISGDPNIVQGTVDPSSSVNGNWNIEVVELAQKAAVITNGFPDKDRSEVGVGYVRFDTPDGRKEVYISRNDSTLEGIARAINQSHLGVKATIINDRKNKDYPYRLVISGDTVGTENNIEFPRLYFLDGDMDFYFEEKREAKNGVVKIDGFELEIADNVLKDFIPGVTLELKQASPGKSINVSVQENKETVSAKIKEFVGAMNGLLGLIQQQNKIDKNTDTTRTLGGDSLIRNVQDIFTRLVQSPQYGVQGDIRQLNQLGIAFNQGGTLDFNEERFRSVLARNSKSVQTFFNGDGFSSGFVHVAKREIANLSNQAFGAISNRKRGLQTKISQDDDQIARKEKHIEKKEEQLRMKFARLEETMSKLRSQGGALAALGGGGVLGGGPLAGAANMG